MSILNHRQNRRPVGHDGSFVARLTALALFSIVTAHAAASASEPQASAPALALKGIARTKVFVLGVDHSTQLVSSRNSPGMLIAFIEMIHPDAICIERSPELAQRGDFYEFTYEVQGIVLPYVASHPTDVCPVDWMPPVEDQKLVFGFDLDEPPEIRTKEAFQGFLVFPDPKTLKSDFFAGDDPATTGPIISRANRQADRADQDFPRRLYQYRTFMQSQRIRAAARAHPAGKLLVVIGYFHKPDLEAILSQDETIELGLPSSIGRPSADAVEKLTSRAQRVAILSFNLLGRQADTGNVDWVWTERALASLEAERNSPEVNLFRARLDQLTGKLAKVSAVRGYRALVNDTDPRATFSWTGVKDTEKIDSYYDPFGNLTVRQRATIELVRALRATGALKEAAQVLANLRSELSVRKARQPHG